MFGIGWILWLSPMNVESNSYLASLGLSIHLIIASVGSGMAQDLVVS